MSQSKLTYEEIVERLKASGISIEDFAYNEIPCKEPFSEKALAAQKLKDGWVELNPNVEKYGTPEYKEWALKYSLFPSAYDVSQREWMEENNIPVFEEIHQEGGEGEGDHWESVKYFKDHGVYIKVVGYYQSYNGTEFYDGWECCHNVKPQEKVITVYE